MLKIFSLEKRAKYETLAKMCNIRNLCNMLRFHILHIFRDYTISFNFEIIKFSSLFNFILFYYFIFFFWGGGGWGWGVAVEVILEDFISEIESFHIIYFYFHRSITQKLNLSQ